jgi:DNA polymerase-3 subunit gamma/tau
VKFIFATTESRKIPVTILSRCQRFDLKRIDAEMLAAHLARIAEKEGVKAQEDALKLIALAAEGSVRDSLSLLDQAIARGAEENGDIAVKVDAVREMIGAADHFATFRLLEVLLRGEVAEALADVETQYGAGSDPLMLVQDALEMVHLVTRVKVAPLALSDISLSERDREAAKKLADALPMPVLTRLWQMLLKGISEVRLAPSPLSALEMLLVRIAYGAQLPTPAEVIRSLNDNAPLAAATEKKTPELGGQGGGHDSLATNQPPPAAIHVNTFEQAVELFNRNREILLYTQLKNDVWLNSFEMGKIELKISPDLPRDFVARVADCLTHWTGSPWKILVSKVAAHPSLHEQETAHRESEIEKVSSNPLIASVMKQFPDATVVGVK